MEIHLFSNEELSHLKFIRQNFPKRIWFEFIQYVFEYENFHFILEIETAQKIMFEEQIVLQYAMKSVIKFVDKKFVSQESSQLITENEIIADIEIIRTKLYFTDFKKISQNFYSSESNQINPDKDLHENINIKKIVVVDVGICLTLENGKVFNFFINENDDDFNTNEFNNQKGDFRKELEAKYKFITLN
ncbi:hypothetical protein [Flavobacterium sp.]|jgi:hypothetical protein|uniref:hypothetical protein n=1 Tax=Flavobacterium sp. TaxID=239 RepID=UPI0037C0D65A